VEASEVSKLTAVEDRHWWYRERREILAKYLKTISGTGKALDIGAAGGGNTRVLREFGWSAIALEYGATGAAVCKERGLCTVRADATRLPFGDATLDLITAFDIIEHIPDDGRAVREMRRTLRLGGDLLIAVPTDPKLWSAHDVAVDHVRRYTSESLRDIVTSNGFQIVDFKNWNVLLKPMAKLRRKRSSGSDLDDPSPLVNSVLSAVIKSERYLPVKQLPGVSAFLHAVAI
jgi:SAM-dependent methyltransferase